MRPTATTAPGSFRLIAASNSSNLATKTAHPTSSSIPSRRYRGNRGGQRLQLTAIVSLASRGERLETGTVDPEEIAHNGGDGGASGKRVACL